MPVMDYREYAKNSETINALKKIPPHVLPYMIDKKKSGNALGQTNGGFFSSITSGLSSIGSSAWDGIETLGSSAWQGLSWSSEQVQDFAGWATGWGADSEQALTEGAKEAAGSGPPQAITSETAAQQAQQSGSWWDTAQNIAGEAWGGFSDLVKKVGIPAGTAYLKYEMTKDIAKEKMERQNKSREQAMQEARGEKSERKKRVEQTAAYVQNHKSTVQKMGYGFNEAVSTILHNTGGKPPNPDAPVSKYLSPKNGSTSDGGGLAIPGFGGSGGGDLMNMLTNYWYIPAGLVVAYFLLSRSS